MDRGIHRRRSEWCPRAQSEAGRVGAAKGGGGRRAGSLEPSVGFARVGREHDGMVSKSWAS